MNAFVTSSSASAFTKSSLHKTEFAGTAVCNDAPAKRVISARLTIVAESYKEQLAKYEKMSAQPEPVMVKSEPSFWWKTYRESLKDKFNPFEKPRSPKSSVDKPNAAILAASTPYFLIQEKINADAFGAGGDPDTMINMAPIVAADRYMAKCVTQQYKATACPSGVYSVKCTEGAVKLQAEESRNAALSAEFRMKHRSSSQKFADFTEIRRKAIIGCYGCSYEEKLVDKYPISARAVVIGSSEAKGTCARYAVGMSEAEVYMASSVDKQSKFRAVPYGVYDVLCSDGNAKFVAEYRRVSGLAARFRAGQLSKNAKEQLKFDSAKYARDYFAHGCSYEENLFNKFPAVAASMRPSSARY